MSANLDHIDLNSDVVSTELENDVAGVKNADTSTEARGAGTLTDSAVYKSLVQEELLDKVGEFERGNDADESFERRMESVDGGIPSGVKINSVDIHANDGFSDLGTREAGEETEARSSSQVEGESVGTRNAGGPGATDVKDVEVKVAADDDEPSPREFSEKEEMEIKQQAEIPEAQAPDADVSDGYSFQERDGHKSEELNIFGDLKPSVSTDGDVGDDVNMKEESSKGELSVSDLVWGKVRSHPWWPGQIFDSSDSTKKAKKYFKKGCYLIAYFGDQSFAWNDASKIKPFRSHFAQMEKQTKLEDFHYAIDCALDEVARRVEFGLACTCMSDYTKIGTQIIVNAGIREEACKRVGGDSFSTASSFEPGKLMEYVKLLGQSPYGGVDRLEFATAQAQLLSFNRWKGYSHLPEFQVCGELLDIDAEISQSMEATPGNEGGNNADTNVKHGNAKVKQQTDNELSSSGEGKSKSQVGSSNKRKPFSDDSGYPNKKEKSLADMLAERRSSDANCKNGSKRKSSGESPSSSVKRKAIDFISSESVVKDDKNISPSRGDHDTSQPKKTYRVGDSILRVASQLNGLTPILKATNGSSKRTAAKDKGQMKSFSGKSQGKLQFPAEEEEDALPGELVSKLYLVARNPLRRCNVLESLVSFFVEFRDSVCPDHHSLLEEEDLPVEDASRDNIVEEANEVESGTPDTEVVKEFRGSDIIIQSNPEDQSTVETRNQAGDLQPETSTVRVAPAAEPQSAVQSVSDLGSEQKISHEVTDLQTEEPVDHLKESSFDDPCLTALILNFSDLDSLPSVTNLNEIFRSFGPLKESETEVLKKSKRAKVVFCRRDDAEAAFSSAGKYSVFGPSLVSYSLKY